MSKLQALTHHRCTVLRLRIKKLESETNLRFEAQQTALDKADEDMTRRLNDHNGLLQEMRDKETLFLPRTEHTTLAERVAALERLQSSMGGRDKIITWGVAAAISAAIAYFLK